MNIKAEYIGIAAGIFTALSLLPQLIKIIKEKKANDISILTLLVLFTGIGLWITYGFMKKDLPIITTNLASLIINILVIGYSIYYKKDKII
jgi:MtN3 and saliva related transmembrane protein